MNNDSSKVYLKDFIIPLLTAIFVLLFNQLFVFYNKNTEAKIEFEQNRLKEQVPVLNRILWFGLRNSRSVNEYVKVQQTVLEIKNGDTSYSSIKTVKSEIIKNPIPSFLEDSTYYAEFIEDLEFFKKNKDIIDHKLRLKLEIVVNQALSLGLQNNYSKRNMEKTIWGQKVILDEWYLNIENLYNYAYEILYHEKFDGKFPYPKANINRIKQIVNEAEVIPDKSLKK